MQTRGIETPDQSPGRPSERRTDPHLGTEVWIVGSRQSRPNRPDAGCPFCPGGLEAPDDYTVRWFPNRWPAMPGDRCEVVLYTSAHDASFADLGTAGARAVVDLWAERTALLGARDDVAFVLVFENRGADVGATIDHPHGQIYAYDHVPERPRRLFDAGWSPIVGDRLVASSPGWSAFVPFAPVYPVSITVAPDVRVGDLASLDDTSRTALASLLVDVLGRLDRLHDHPLPYMMWIMQRPVTSDDRWADAWMHIEIVSPWRHAGVPRFIAAAEVAAGEFFNPVDPDDLVARLRELGHG